MFREGSGVLVFGLFGLRLFKVFGIYRASSVGGFGVSVR